MLIYGRPGNFTWPILSKIFKQDFLIEEIEFLNPILFLEFFI